MKRRVAFIHVSPYFTQQTSCNGIPIPKSRQVFSLTRWLKSIPCIKNKTTFVFGSRLHLLFKISFKTANKCVGRLFNGIDQTIGNAIVEMLKKRFFLLEKARLSSGLHAEVFELIGQNDLRRKSLVVVVE